MIKTYELINGTLKEVVHSDEPKVELRYYLNSEFQRIHTNSKEKDFEQLSIIAKNYSPDGLDLILASLSNRQSLYLGTYSEPKELKGIEVINVLTEGAYFVAKPHAFGSTGNYTVTLIERNYCKELDLFVKHEDGYAVVYLGHWNDGVVK